MSRAIVQAGINARLSLFALLLFAVSACSEGAIQSPAENVDDERFALLSSGSLPPAPATGVWSIETIIDDGEVVEPWEGEGGYSTRVVITNDGATLMAYDYCGTVSTQVSLKRADGSFRADLALDESTSMAACKQSVSSDGALFTPVDDTTISVLARGLDVTLRLTDEPCPTFLADGCGRSVPS